MMRRSGYFHENALSDFYAIHPCGVYDELNFVSFQRTVRTGCGATAPIRGDEGSAASTVR
ncbi:hypothetical protein ACVWWD_005710 [Mesorhizobium sp. URHB0026]